MHFICDLVIQGYHVYKDMADYLQTDNYIRVYEKW